MSSEITIERRVVVFAVWMTVGIIGICLMLQGFQQDMAVLGLFGVASLALGFAAHLLVNRIFVQTFSAGETAFGTAVITLLGIILIIGWSSGDYTKADLIIGGALLLTIVTCVLGYLVNRFGARGAFSRFHSTRPGERQDR